jgi:hypothetical protein
VKSQEEKCSVFQIHGSQEISYVTDVGGVAPGAGS